MSKSGTTHSKYRPIKVITTNGQELVMRSTYQADILKLDIDPSTHPAWNKDIINFVNTKAGQVESFNSRFNGLSFLNKTAKE
ncbi:MAG: 50S ribosomal protein L31 [Alphaproteobacteria bacterium]|jgi:large subunit ribosomal protein L31|nr:50S ribosomal protein L31 [Candidatus Jidaibacter sp.]